MASPPKTRFKIWPDPPEGKPYGPTPKQRLLFIEKLPLVDTWLDAQTGAPVDAETPGAINIKRTTPTSN